MSWVLSPEGKELIGGTRPGWLCQGPGKVWGWACPSGSEPQALGKAQRQTAGGFRVAKPASDLLCHLFAV